MAGRGSFIESFGLFGYDLDDYDALFADQARARCSRFAPRAIDLGVYPRPEQDPLPVWIAVGGNPQSAARAGLLGLPMALAIIGGYPERFAPFAELHRRADERGRPRLPAALDQLARVHRRDQPGGGADRASRPSRR